MYRKVPYYREKGTGVQGGRSTGCAFLVSGLSHQLKEGVFSKGVLAEI